MRYEISLETAGLLYAIFIYAIHRFLYTDPAPSVRAFRRCLVINVVLVLTDILTATAINHYTQVPPFINQAANCLYYFLCIYLTYTLVQYAECLAEKNGGKRKSVIIPRIVLWLDACVLTWNLFNGSHLYFYFDETGYHYGPLYALANLVPVTEIIYFLVRLFSANPERIRKRIGFITCAVALFILSATSAFFLGNNHLIFGLGSTFCLTVILMCLETPEYTRLTAALRSCNADLEQKAEEKIRQINRTKENIISGMAACIGEKNGSGEHLKRTCRLLELMADALREKTDDAALITLLDNMKTAAPLHGFDHISLPGNPSGKQNDHTDKDIAVLSENARKSGEIVRKVLNECNDPQLTAVAVNMVKYKGENYDGSGYPDGLARTRIPLEARVVTLCDELDRQISARSGTVDTAVERAIVAVEKEMGTRFDPKLIEPLESIREKIKQYYGRQS